MSQLRTERWGDPLDDGRGPRCQAQGPKETQAEDGPSQRQKTVRMVTRSGEADFPG